MTGSISLRTLMQYDEVKADKEYLKLTIDMSELSHFLGTNNKVPNSFIIKGREADVEVFQDKIVFNRDNEVDYRAYLSKDTVESAVGPRKVSVIVFND